MKESYLDLATDKLIKDMDSIKEHIRIRYKGTKPYRGVKISEADRIANYLVLKNTMPPEIEDRFINDPLIGANYLKYNQKMDELARGYKNG